MFTGIVEERGEVVSLTSARLVLACRVVPRDAPVGSSVSVNGTCLTVVENAGETIAFDLSEETLARTSLGRLQAGAAVNLERPVTLGTRLGGHLVQGHVDGVGEVVGVEPEGVGGARVAVRVPDHLLRYVVEKGSITIDGVSLTVAAVEDANVTVSLIPHTLGVTTFGSVSAGDAVNLEVDVIAKYVERLMEGRDR
ncbi:MAG TPA: riboflavin synthase [Actinomycetota bacterium]|jgi:riboflavin synthase